MSNKKLLKIVGYPRNGNTYLSHILNASYYPEEEMNNFWHTVLKLDAYPKVIVPYRNPLDCIASWHLLLRSKDLAMDIKYYIRFYTAVLERNNLVLLKFESFTKDFQYVYLNINKHFGIDPVAFPTDFQIKETMLNSNRENNLPRDNQEELNSIKERLQDMLDFDKCIQLYERLKEQ